MSKILLKNIDYLVTMDNQDNIFRGYDLLVDGNIISKIEKDINITNDMQVIDCSKKVIMPGFVNTHHHLYQTMFRGIDEVQEMPLFPWLIGLYEFWKHLDAETVYYGSMIGFSELIRTGCTMTTDHHYVFPEKSTTGLIETQFKAAEEIGMRFHATRGSMSLGKKDGGLPPNSVVQLEEDILIDSERLIDKFQDNSKYSMRKIALAPCSPFSVTKDLMIKSAELARKKGVMLHTHLAETLDEENFTIQKYGMRPLELMEDVGWLGNDVWFAHGVWFNDAELDKLSKTKTGVAHCPSSNMKLNSGICRTSEFIEKGIKLGLAVDGSASNDGSNMWEEVRRSYLLNHLKYGDKGLSAYKTLKMATRGGANLLNRDDVGYLSENMGADLIAFDLNDICYAGSHNPLTSIVCLGNSSLTDMTMINGKIVCEKGILKNINEREIFLNAHKHAKDLVALERSFK